MEAARTKNFRYKEVELLLSIVEEKAYIIENKKTDKLTTELKDTAWKEVEKEFNAATDGVNRTYKVLRTKYLNLKNDLRRKRQHPDEKPLKFETTICDNSNASTSNNDEDTNGDESAADSEINYPVKMPKVESPRKIETKQPSCWVKVADVKAKMLQKKTEKELQIMEREHEIRIGQMKEIHDLQIRFMIEKHEAEINAIQQTIV